MNKNFKYLGLGLLALMFLIFLTREITGAEIPHLLSIIVGVSGLLLLGIHYFKVKEFKKFGLMLTVYLIIMVALIILQFN